MKADILPTPPVASSHGAGVESNPASGLNQAHQAAPVEVQPATNEDPKTAKLKFDYSVPLTPAQAKAAYKWTGIYRNGKPVFRLPTKQVISEGSEFQTKQLCDGRTFTLGFACAFSCTFCYSPSVLALHPGVLRILKETGLQFQDVIIEKDQPLQVLEKELLRKGGQPKYADPNDHQVIYSSPLVDVAANRDLIDQTVAACKMILNYTPWQIRLLSKSAGLKTVAERLSAYSERMLYGLSIGTLDDKLAATFELNTSSPSARLGTLHWLQNNGFRTFGMTCPSLPQENYGRFAMEMAEAIRADRCEKVWAEVLNVRGQSFTKTFDALIAGGFTAEAERLKRVSTSPEAWEQYARDTFTAHTKVVPSEKLRFLQYVRKGECDWWSAQEARGAILLGAHATPRIASATDAVQTEPASTRLHPEQGEQAHPAAASTMEVLNESMPAYWASRVNEHVDAGVGSWVAAGRELLAAKKELGHGKFQMLFEPGMLRIDQRTVEKLMKIAKHPVLSNSTSWSNLPATLNSLAILSRLDEKRLQKAIDGGQVSPTMTIKETNVLVSALQPTKRKTAAAAIKKPDGDSRPPSLGTETQENSAPGQAAEEFGNPPLPDEWASYMAEFRQSVMRLLSESPQFVGSLQTEAESLLKEIRDFRDALLDVEGLRRLPLDQQLSHNALAGNSLA